MSERYGWRTHDGAPWVGSLADAKASGCEYWRCYDYVPIAGASHAVTPHLSIEEQRRLHIQTGRDIRDYDDLKSYYRETGCRSMEKGEKEEVSRREIKEWERSGGEGPAPGEQTPNWGQNRNSVDIKELYRRIKSR